MRITYSDPGAAWRDPPPSRRGLAIVAWLLLAGAGVRLGAAATAVVLVDNGTTRCCVVVGPESEFAESAQANWNPRGTLPKWAAEDVATYLGRMGGATIAVGATPVAGLLPTYVGGAPGAENPGASTLHGDAYVVDVSAERIVLHGESRRAVFDQVDPLVPTVLARFGSGKTMRRHLADCFSLLIRDAEAPYRADAPGAAEVDRSCRETVHRLPWSLLRGDPLGRILVSMLMPALNQARAKEVAGIAVLRGTALTLALHDWRRRHGRPPARLDDLVPAYLTALPFDPCTGAAQTPFVYRAEGSEWRLYCVGPDQRDDGGQANLLKRDHRRPGKEDICFDSNEFVPASASPEADGAPVVPPAVIPLRGRW